MAKPRRAGQVTACQSLVILGHRWNIRRAVASPVNHAFPASHALALVELVRRWRVEPSELLDALGRREEELLAPDARSPVDVFIALVERRARARASPASATTWAPDARLRARLPGVRRDDVGDLGEAIELAARYAPTRSTAVALRLHEAERSAAVVIEERADFGSARDVWCPR